MLLFFLQDLLVPKDSSTGVTVLVGEDGSFSRVLARGIDLIGVGEGALTKVRDRAMPAIVPEEFLDTHVEVGGEV